MHERGAGGHRGLDVVDDGQVLVLHLDEGGCALRDLRRERGDARDDLALEAHDVAGEQRAVLHDAAEEHVGHVLVGDARRTRLAWRGGGHVDARDAGVRPSAYRNFARSWPVTLRSAV